MSLADAAGPAGPQILNIEFQDRSASITYVDPAQEHPDVVLVHTIQVGIERLAEQLAEIHESASQLVDEALLVLQAPPATRPGRGIRR